MSNGENKEIKKVEPLPPRQSLVIGIIICLVLLVVAVFLLSIALRAGLFFKIVLGLVGLVLGGFGVAFLGLEIKELIDYYRHPLREERKKSQALRRDEPRADPLSLFIKTLPPGDYLILSIVSDGIAMALAQEIVAIANRAKCVYRIFPLDRPVQFGPHLLSGAAVMVIGGLDSFAASSVAVNVRDRLQNQGVKLIVRNTIP